MSPSRLFLVASLLVCGAVKGEAKPLSFNGVQVPQKWGEFLKEHPRAEVFMPSDAESMLSRAQQLALQAKRRSSLLVETLPRKQLFPDALYFFDNGTLHTSCFVTDVRPAKTNTPSLKVLLNKLLTSLGTPTAQGPTVEEGRKERKVLLVWKTPSQCAYARLSWPLSKAHNPATVEVWIIDARWRAVDISFQTIWPEILAPNKEDLIRKQQVVALLEEVRPGSTRHLATLEAAPAINLFSRQGDKS